MESITVIARHEPWNKGKLTGQKAPFNLKGRHIYRRGSMDAS
jgi:hypothetical protein